MLRHFIKRRERLSIQYALRLKSIPYHPTHRAISQLKYTIKFANKPTAIPTLGLRVKSILDDIPLIELGDIARVSGTRKSSLDH